MKYLVLALLLLTGCQHTKTEVSEILYENAIVVTKLHEPSYHKTNIELKAINLAGKGAGSLGYSYGGNIGIGLGGGLMVSSSTIPEKFGILFRCQHGTFTSQGSARTHKALHDRLKEGQRVRVRYREVYRTTYEDKEVVNRVLTGFDFLDAE